MKYQGRYFRYYLFFIFPALLLYFLFYFFPFLGGFAYSFSDWNGIKTPQFVGLNNYFEIFNSQKDQDFLPGSNTHYLFKENYELPFTIKASDYNGMLIRHIKNPEEINILKRAYRKLNQRTYILNENFNEFILYDKLNKLLDNDAKKIDKLLVRLKNDIHRKDQIDSIIREQNFDMKINSNTSNEIKDILEDYQIIIKAKKIIAEYLYKEEITFGALGFTLFYSIINLIFANCFALLIALFLEKQIKINHLLQSIFFIPALLSIIVVSFIWSLEFEKILSVVTNGGFNAVDPYNMPLIVSAAGVWRNCGFLILIYLGGLKSIPKEYLDIAIIQGANGWHQFFKIKGPMLGPAFVAGLIFSLVSSLKAYEMVIGITGMTTSYGFNTASWLLDIIIDSVDKGRYGYAMAKSIVLGSALAALTGVAIYFFKRRERKI